MLGKLPDGPARKNFENQAVSSKVFANTKVLVFIRKSPTDRFSLQQSHYRQGKKSGIRVYLQGSWCS